MLAVGCGGGGDDPFDAGAPLPDAQSSDGGVAVDADRAPDASCSVGTATNSAAADDPALFGEVVPFAEGDDIPAGDYTLHYVDGCFKYSNVGQDWTIHARLDGSTTWWLVGESSSERLVILPGTVGFTAANGAFTVFSDCIAANLLVDPVEYTHTGGPLGIFVADTNYPDNVPGEDGRNPAWEIRRADCVP